MNALDDKIIEVSKKKVVMLILGSCVMVASSARIFSLDQAAIQSILFFRPFSPKLIHGIGLVGIGFFGLCRVIWFKKVFDKKPGLVFNSSGIVDNSNGVSSPVQAC